LYKIRLNCVGRTDSKFSADADFAGNKSPATAVMLKDMMSGMLCNPETDIDNSNNVGILSSNYLVIEIPDNTRNFSIENTVLTDNPVSRHHASCLVLRANM
jgi:hypothetical protein